MAMGREQRAAGGRADGGSGPVAATIATDDLVRWLSRFAELVADRREYLTELDAAIGDADHGINMDRGLSTVVARLPDLLADGATPGSFTAGVARVLISTVGGASGPLYGTFFLRLGGALGGEAAVSPETFAAALRQGLDGVVARGRTQLDDKTMVDAMAPAVEAIESALAGRAGSSGLGWAAALRDAAVAAAAGRDRVTPLIARKGRASYLGERSAGHADPGATSTILLFEALRDAFAGSASSI
ncbi:MAG TPA: dihydroxyacetone kinase subunit DhaL [Candidatus Limnocylindrales bacterium]